MDASTISHYDRHAADICGRYEAADMSCVQALLMRYLPEHASVLEIGCGSGRDAAFLAAHGYDVLGIDASDNMVGEAKARHPELADSMFCQPFPLAAASPLVARTFDAVVSIATLMHVPDHDLFECVSQIRSLLRPHGIVILSTSTGRQGLDASRDGQGRLFVERTPDEIQLLFERMGFRLVTTETNVDAFARGIVWHTLVMRHGDVR